jgi:hypothetical protein
MTNRILPALMALALLYGLREWNAPCARPLPYRIGDLDQRFGLPRDQLRSALKEAEAVWEDAAGRDLFVHDDGAALPVHFVYDNRQRIMTENVKRRAAIREAGSSADTLKAEYAGAKARHETARRDFQAAQSAHDARVAAHNRTVETVNARGGASGSERIALERESAEIEIAAEAVEKKRLKANALASHVNGLSERHNELVDEVNENVDAVNAKAGIEFRQGLYTRDAEGTRIEIFEFLDRADLVHVLAHELGHALGLGHNDDPQSILYGVNSSRTSKPSRADLAALHEHCGF